MCKQLSLFLTSHLLFFLCMQYNNDNKVISCTNSDSTSFIMKKKNNNNVCSIRLVSIKYMYSIHRQELINKRISTIKRQPIKVNNKQHACVYLNTEYEAFLFYMFLLFTVKSRNHLSCNCTELMLLIHFTSAYLSQLGINNGL